jgi:hypothetical protein
MTNMEIIFTSGYHPDDDEITKIKGHRSDILLMDNHGNYYELNFVTINRLKSDLDYNLSNGKKYFTDICLIVLEEVTKEQIINCIKDLASFNYFKRYMPIENIELNKNWIRVLIN